MTNLTISPSWRSRLGDKTVDQVTHLSDSLRVTHFDKLWSEINLVFLCQSPIRQSVELDSDGSVVALGAGKDQQKDAVGRGVAVHLATVFLRPFTGLADAGGRLVAQVEVGDAEVVLQSADLTLRKHFFHARSLT